MAIRTPPLENVLFIGNRLSAAGIPYALGGSGLLASLGLLTQVRDWDLTTDASWDQIKPLVDDLNYDLVPRGELFATDFLCKIYFPNASIDLMGKFSIKQQSEIYSVPTRITNEWRGIPLGCPVAWERAYELMGRADKAELLRKYNSGRALG